MKVLLIGLFVSSAAMATTYECNLHVKLNGKEVGTIQASKVGVGFTMGTIAITKIKEKKNIFGKVTKWDELHLYGTLQNAGELDTTQSNIKNSIDRKIALNSFSRRGGQINSQDISMITGVDNFDINSNDNQYSVSGNCVVKP